MTGPTLGGADRRCMCEDLLQCLVFGQVIGLRTGAVQIDIIDSVRFESGTLQRGPHGVCGLAAVRSRRGHVIGVAALTITAYGQPRLPRLGQTYQCETAGLTDIDAAPVTITG